jgi:hypothetical protein
VEDYFSQALNVKSVSDVKRIEIYTAEPLVPDPIHSENKTAIANLETINRQVVIKFRHN